MSDPKATALCRSCGATIWWGRSSNGRAAPFDVDPKTGAPLDAPHFGSCPDARRWSRNGRHGGAARGRDGAA